MSDTFNLNRELEEVNEKYKNSDAPFGATLLTGVNFVSAPRTIMFTNHLNQFLNLSNPEPPLVFTSYENLVGEHSTAKYKSDRDWTVVGRVTKFHLPDELKEKEIVTLFLYDKEKDYYDMVTKKRFEDLTENYGFEYETKNFDEKEVGDKVKKGELLFHSKSYDEHGNYRYGKNIPFAYLIANKLVEDGIVASESLAKALASKSVTTVKVSLNDNDFFCNLYGDTEEYEGFPNIGESTKKNVVCAKRRIFNEQKLYDLMDGNLRKINFNSDDIYYSDGRVADITIYCNKKPIEDIEETVLNRQLLKYLREQNEYYKEIYNQCRDIMRSGSKYSKDIAFYYKKAKDILDPDVLWRDESSVFGNIIAEITIEGDVGLSVGQKITGRYGNKGVIAKILPDNQMPYLEDGTIIHLLFNTNGVINRMNEFQLFEQSITFCAKRVTERMKTLDSLKDKFELLIKFVSLLSKSEEEQLRKYYKHMSVPDRESFIEKIQESGNIYITVPPFWQDAPLFEKIENIYNEFPWIKPYTIYINKFGRPIELINNLVCGKMYVMKLKQTSKQGFSVRATGSVNSKGLPGKSNKAKNNRELHSNTPIRMGEQEGLNMNITNSSQRIKKLHLMYRSSPKARMKLATKLTKGKPLKKFKLSDDMVDRNVELFNALLKVLGYELVIEDDVVAFKQEDHTFLSTPSIRVSKQFKEIQRHFKNESKDVFEEGFMKYVEELMNTQIDLEDGILRIDVEE